MTRFCTLKKFFALSFIFLAFTAFSFSEPITDRDFGFSLDVPEGFEISDYTEDGMSYVFSHPNIPVTLIMKITADPDAISAKEVLKTNLTKLSAKGDTDSFIWSGKTCGISNFSMVIDTSYTGWAITAPVRISGYYVLLLCYAPS